MPIKIVRREHWEVLGSGLLLFSSPELNQPGELYSGWIIEDAALLSKAPAIIRKEKTNVGRPAPEGGPSEFERRRSELVKEFRIKCILVIEGQNQPGIEIISTYFPELGTIAEVVRRELSQDFNVSLHSKEIHEREVGVVNPQPIRIALGPEERSLRKNTVVSRIADLVKMVNGKLGYVGESDEAASDVLD